jgi:hypothetical protein
MGLRVPRSVLVMDRASLQRLRNYTKGVMERTICADAARYEQITELLCYPYRCTNCGAKCERGKGSCSRQWERTSQCKRAS